MQGKKLEELARSSGIALSDVAKGLDTEYPNLYRLFQREHLTFPQLIKVCKFFNVPLSHFLEENELDVLEKGDANKVPEPEKIEIELETIKKEKSYLERENALLREMVEILRKDQESQNEEKKTPERSRTAHRTPQFQPQKR